MFILKRNLGKLRNYDLEEAPLRSEVLAKKSYRFVGNFLKEFWKFSVYYGRFLADR